MINYQRAVLLFFAIVAGMIFFNCERKYSSVVTTNKVETDEVPWDTISFSKTDRNDIPPPPKSPWWNIDTSNLAPCQSEIWTFLKNIYPIHDKSNTEYQLYSILNEPSNVFANRNFLRNQLTFFSDYFPDQYLSNPEYSCPKELKPTFFQDAIGEPTCIATNNINNETTYYYYLKLRYRHGPCPFTILEGEEIGIKCSQTQIQYCAVLRLIFSKRNEELIYIDFVGTQ